jgi:hypothetical protein
MDSFDFASFVGFDSTVIAAGGLLFGVSRAGFFSIFARISIARAGSNAVRACSFSFNITASDFSLGIKG